MGIIRFVTNKIEFINAKNEAIKAALEAIGIEGEKYAKLHLDQEPRRIDTGRLRNSISHSTGGESGKEDVAYIGTNVEYAPYVEFGTVKMAPNHFLKGAASEHSDTYREIVRKYLRD